MFIYDSSDWWSVGVVELPAHTDGLFDEEGNIEATFADISMKKICRHRGAYLWEVQTYCCN